MRRTRPPSLALALLLIFALTPRPALAADATEAEILALESSGELLPPPALVDEIAADLALLRNRYPFVEQLWIFARGDWAPGDIFLKVDPATASAVAGGQPSALDPLNDLYGPIVEINTFGPDWIFYSFAAPYHPDRLGEIYRELPEVLGSDVNYYIGDGSDIDREEPGLYRLRYAWGDCPAGCMYEHYWRIRVQASEATIVSQWGDPLSGTSAPGARISALVGELEVAPNPFNPQTQVRFELSRGAVVTLELFDLRGQRLRRIDRGRRPEGPHSLALDGVDQDGRSLASGSYFVALCLDGERVATQRLALVR